MAPSSPSPCDIVHTRTPPVALAATALSLSLLSLLALLSSSLTSSLASSLSPPPPPPTGVEAGEAYPPSSDVGVFATIERVPVWSDQLKPILVQEVKERLERLGEISDVRGSLQRTFLSPAALRAARAIDSWMQDAGMRTWTDGVGNVHGRLDGADPLAPALLIGSHMDTVMDAGKYDGLLGVVCAIAAVKAFNKFDGAKQLLRPVEVIAFSDEEGVRFQSTFLGSSAIAGTSPADILHATDSKGVTFADALHALGLEGSLEGLASLKYDPANVWAYVEAHIEQGPVLEELGMSLGVVPAIAGQTRLRVSMEGEQGHAGTVPMRMRRDPLAGAAAAVVAVEEACQPKEWDTSGTPAMVAAAQARAEADASGLVCTVGQMDVWPGASNVIPGRVSFSVDIRARADGVRLATVQNLTEHVKLVCARRQLRCNVELKHQAPAVECSPSLVDLLASAAGETMQEIRAHTGARASSSVGSEPLAVPRIVSGAGHDAMAMAHLTQVAMLFVRCKGGVSHRPDEAVASEDLLAASAALLNLIRSPQVSRPL